MLPPFQNFISLCNTVRDGRFSFQEDWQRSHFISLNLTELPTHPDNMAGGMVKKNETHRLAYGQSGLTPKAGRKFNSLQIK